MKRFPQDTDRFIEKLNSSIFPITVKDEEVLLVNGKCTRDLDHDNVIANSVEIWTKPDKRGDKITSFGLKQNPGTGWKTTLSMSLPPVLFEELDRVYVTYETTGDQIEAEDINNIQESIVSTQREVLRHERDTDIHIVNRTIDGGTF